MRIPALFSFVVVKTWADTSSTHYLGNRLMPQGNEL